jgi:hypothetical protein
MNPTFESKEIPINKLTSIFNDTTNSYKYYWFLSIIDILNSNDSDEILIEELGERMFESVWYPLNYFNLSFGAQDSFKNISLSIAKYIDEDNLKDSILTQLNEKADFTSLNNIRSEVKKLTRWVPYRFIRPFFKNELQGLPDQQVNNEIKDLAYKASMKNPNLVPYYFVENKIVINRPWKEYLIQSTGLLKGYIFWELVRFVQKNNPNVSGIPSKLFRPVKRDLSLNTKSWEYYLLIKGETQCIYSKNIVPPNFSLDHFIPWSYTVHDLNWNILPVSKQVNSSKGKCLPSLDNYLNDFINLQYDFLTCLAKSDFEKKNSILEHYSLLFNSSISQILNGSKIYFERKLSETIIPMTQIASNIGFQKDWKYKELIK